MVGLMRSGRMLVEDNPSSLMQKFDMPSLEKVFLGLCRRQGKHLSGKEGDKWTIWYCSFRFDIIHFEILGPCSQKEKLPSSRMKQLTSTIGCSGRQPCRLKAQEVTGPRLKMQADIYILKLSFTWCRHMLHCLFFQTKIFLQGIISMENLKNVVCGQPQSVITTVEALPRGKREERGSIWQSCGSGNNQ